MSFAKTEETENQKGSDAWLILSACMVYTPHKLIVIQVMCYIFSTTQFTEDTD